MPFRLISIIFQESNYHLFFLTLYLFFFQTDFSRIARVCKKDTGGPHKFKYKWTTFLKTRLNCSAPGDTPFYFNDIQATTNFIQDGQDTVVYGVFNTPDNAIGMKKGLRIVWLPIHTG